MPRRLATPFINRNRIDRAVVAPATANQITRNQRRVRVRSQIHRGRKGVLERDFASERSGVALCTENHHCLVIPTNSSKLRDVPLKSTHSYNPQSHLPSIPLWTPLDHLFGKKGSVCTRVNCMCTNTVGKVWGGTILNTIPHNTLSQMSWFGRTTLFHVPTTSKPTISSVTTQSK